ncbi:MAG TPA: CoA transferase [Myxococcota bacterium]|nr:CoA transferase [Myxococcota bacterium]
MLIPPAPRPFSALRVLDLSTEIAGPYATKLLCDQGADVLKIEESPGDPLRRRTAARIELPEGADSALFQFLNAGKRAAVCGTDDAARCARVRELARGADVLFESGGPAALARRVGSVAELRAANPRLSVVSITPWGTTGPWADRPATEWTLQAATGFTARRGIAERGPVGAGGRLGEYAAGAFAAVAALAAWTGARASGAGRHVDVSIFEAMIACGPVFADLNGQFIGGLLPMYFDVPSIEPAADGWVGFAPVTSQQWEDFCLMIGRPEIGREERFRWAQERSAHLAFFHEVVHAWTRVRKVSEILEQTELLRIPSAPIGNGATLPRTDHFIERGVFVENPGGFLQPRVPFALAEVPRAAIARAPQLGEHTLEWNAARGEQPAVGCGGEDGPLAGLRIVDLTAFWAGPFATNLLAMLGAEVIKVESIQRPDGIRFVNAKPGPPVWEASSIFQGVNTEKRAITLRLDHEEGRRALRALIERGDVLIENFSARVLEQFELGWETLSAWNTQLVLVRMPAWGLDGPWRDRTGFAMNIEQACGIAWRSGYPDLPINAAVCDPIGGLHAVVALFAALEHRSRTGRGQQVEVPLVEPGLNLAAEQVIEHSAYGVLLGSEGNRGPDAAPQGVYAARDGERVAIAVADEAQWCALAAVFAGSHALFADASLASAEARRARHDAIDAALAQACAAHGAAEIADRLAAAGVPAQVLANAHRVMPHPQLEHRGYYQSLEHPHTGRARYPGLPFVGLADGRPRRPPPTLGQHNREVLAGELGIAPGELARWEREGIIGTQPAWIQAPPGGES